MKIENVPFYEEFNKLNLLYFGVFGSRLYGSDVPESDWDFKGIYMPTKRQVYLGHYPKSIHFKTNKEVGKNSADDVDIEIYSLNYFLKLAMDGDTAALDMLHTPEDQVYRKSPIWNELTDSRQEFYTKTLKSFIGYARTQAAKYGVKGTRLADMKAVLDFAYARSHTTEISYDDMIANEGHCPVLAKLDERVADVWQILPEGEHIHKLTPHPDDKNQYRMYQVCGQKFQETVTLEYMRAGIQKKYDEYGARARKAEENEGIDWKAISHAIRAAYQLVSIMTVGTISYPLNCGPTLRKIKNGEMDYLTEVLPLMESLIDSCEQLSHISNYREETDRQRWEDWLVRLIQREVFGEILNNI